MISRIVNEYRKGVIRPQDVMLADWRRGLRCISDRRGGAVVSVVRRAGFFSVAALIGAKAFGRRYPAPMDAGLRWMLFLVPHASRFLAALLDPKRGERMLEIGPGVGQHAVFMARRVGPAGAVEVLDVQDDMLEAVVKRAGALALRTLWQQEAMPKICRTVTRLSTPLT